MKSSKDAAPLGSTGAHDCVIDSTNCPYLTLPIVVRRQNAMTELGTTQTPRVLPHRSSSAGPGAGRRTFFFALLSFVVVTFATLTSLAYRALRKLTAPAPRVYVYRKSGRTIWDVEIWLPDGTRKTWRSGLEEREAALSAGLERARAMLVLPDVGTPDAASVATEPPKAALCDGRTPVQSQCHAAPSEVPRSTERRPQKRHIAFTKLHPPKVR